ncbi:MAG: glycine cleavage T C-terminal barrel domain-containing protein [Saprospiraceae bacterium]
MGYVATAFAAEGTEIRIVVGKKSLEAVVVKAPFYKN